MSDVIAQELAALLALCRGPESVYRKLPTATPQCVALIFETLGDRIVAILAKR